MRILSCNLNKTIQFIVFFCNKVSASRESKFGSFNNLLYKVIGSSDQSRQDLTRDKVPHIFFSTQNIID